MKTIRFTLPITPRAQKRDRIGSFGGHGRSYKDPKQREYEGKIAALLEQYRPEKAWEGPISLSVVCWLPIPKSKPKKWKEKALAGFILPTGKPDCSNLAKNIEDIMNGIFWRDDAQIVSLEVAKRYSETPEWAITMRELGIEG